MIEDGVLRVRCNARQAEHVTTRALTKALHGNGLKAASTNKVDFLSINSSFFPTFFVAVEVTSFRVQDFLVLFPDFVVQVDFFHVVDLGCERRFVWALRVAQLSWLLEEDPPLVDKIWGKFRQVLQLVFRVELACCMDSNQASKGFGEGMVVVFQNGADCGDGDEVKPILQEIFRLNLVFQIAG